MIVVVALVKVENVPKYPIPVPMEYKMVMKPGLIVVAPVSNVQKLLAYQMKNAALFYAKNGLALLRLVAMV